MFGRPRARVEAEDTESESERKGTLGCGCSPFVRPLSCVLTVCDKLLATMSRTHNGEQQTFAAGVQLK